MNILRAKAPLIAMAVFSILAVLLLLILLSGTREILNGYKLVKISADIYVISSPKHVEVIEPNVSLYGVKYPYIYGYREQSTRYQDSLLQPAGFFIIDTQRYLVVRDLDKEKFLEHFSAFGLDGEFLLKNLVKSRRFI